MMSEGITRLWLSARASVEKALPPHIISVRMPTGPRAKLFIVRVELISASQASIRSRGKLYSVLFSKEVCKCPRHRVYSSNFFACARASFARDVRDSSAAVWFCNGAFRRNGNLCGEVEKYK